MLLTEYISCNESFRRLTWVTLHPGRVHRTHPEHILSVIDQVAHQAGVARDGHLIRPVMVSLDPTLHCVVHEWLTTI